MLAAGMGRSTIGLTVLLAAGPLSGLGASGAARLSLADYCNGSDAGDDTGCIGQWIEAGHAGNRGLYVPPGTYLYAGIMPLYSGLDLLCDRDRRPVFRRHGGSGIFLQAASPVRRVRIEGCAFDVNGSTTPFLAVIDVSPDSPKPSEDIKVLRNRIYDSAILGGISAEQRQYILLLNCRDCWVEHNHLSEGGRIKLGRPGHRLRIRNNRVELVNDNAITVVDVGSGVSTDILIQDNHIQGPKAIGIFFGADGETQTSPTLTTARVRIDRNVVHGNWSLACILGTLPAVAYEIEVTRNICVKGGAPAQSSTGIRIRRTEEAPGPARKIVVERNRIKKQIGMMGPALDHGGISFSGAHHDVRIGHNEIGALSGRAMLLRGSLSNAVVLDNLLLGGVLQIEGAVQGQVQEPYTLGEGGSVTD